MQHNNAKKPIDEMQNLKLLQIEEIGLWLAFWGLVAAIMIQLFLKASFQEVAGELVLLAGLSCYISFACIRNGLWTRTNNAPTVKNNLLYSIIPSLISGIIIAVRCTLVLHKQIPVIVLLVMMVGTYVVCFVVLEITRWLYQKSRNRLDCTDKEQ